MGMTMFQSFQNLRSTARASLMAAHHRKWQWMCLGSNARHEMLNYSENSSLDWHLPLVIANVTAYLCQKEQPTYLGCKPTNRYWKRIFFPNNHCHNPNQHGVWHLVCSYRPASPVRLWTALTLWPSHSPIVVFTNQSGNQKQMPAGDKQNQCWVPEHGSTQIWSGWFANLSHQTSTHCPLSSWDASINWSTQQQVTPMLTF